MNKPRKSPSPEFVRLTVEPYDSETNLVHRLAAEEHATVARAYIESPDGAFAGVFLALRCRHGRWYAEISHDATDYNTDTTRFRSARIPLRFFGA